MKYNDDMGKLAQPLRTLELVTGLKLDLRFNSRGLPLDATGCIADYTSGQYDIVC
jgi:hypothetical protein